MSFKRLQVTIPLDLYERLVRTKKRLGVRSWVEFLAKVVTMVEGKGGVQPTEGEWVKRAENLEEEVARLKKEVEELKRLVLKGAERGEGQGRRATRRQIEYIRDLLRRAPRDVRDYVLERYGVKRPEELAEALTIDEASRLIDEVKALLTAEAGEVEEPGFTPTPLKQAVKEVFGVEDPREQSLIETILRMPRGGDGKSIDLAEVKRVIGDYGFQVEEELERLERLGVGRVSGGTFTLSDEAVKLVAKR